MQNYYTIPHEQFSQHQPFDFTFVDTHADLCRVFARELVDLIKSKESVGEMTKVIVPVGPIGFSDFTDLCNKEGVSCKTLVIFAMDEYLDSDGRPLPVDHPLSFKAFLQRSLNSRLDPDKRLPDEQLIVPDPMTAGLIPKMIQDYGGIDITYGGLGINGHIAFNSPPDEDVDLDIFKATTVRKVNLREGDIIQFAIGGTFGNIEIIPTSACTLGMAELLNTHQIHMLFMRPWHAGVLRRALFGPVTPSFPGSLVQLHPNVKVTMTSEAAQVPDYSLLMGFEE
jgi:glucosamine-6-phosphate deaminase